MPQLFFYTKYKVTYLYFFSIAIFSFFTLTACVAQQSKVENSYYCELTKLLVCDKKTLTSCTEVPNTDFTEPVHTVFYPETLSAQSYAGSRLIEKVDMSFWHVLDKAIFMAGYGINLEGDATVWSGSIDRKNGDLIVTALSVDYSYIVKGSCQIR
jgi:hypothetical protein